MASACTMSGDVLALADRRSERRRGGDECVLLDAITTVVRLLREGLAPCGGCGLADTSMSSASSWLASDRLQGGLTRTSRTT
jgi:hypothetical protein